MSVAPKRQITFALDVKVYDRLAEHARKFGVPTGTYARMLFDAAYAARCAPTGDADLDAKVAGTLILSGAGLEREVVARALDVPEDLVDRIMTAWRLREVEARG